MTLYLCISLKKHKRKTNKERLSGEGVHDATTTTGHTPGYFADSPL